MERSFRRLERYIIIERNLVNLFTHVVVNLWGVIVRLIDQAGYSVNALRVHIESLSLFEQARLTVVLVVVIFITLVLLSINP